MVRKKAGRPAVAMGRARVRPHAVRSARRDKAAGPRWPVLPTVPAPQPACRSRWAGQRARRWDQPTPAAASDRSRVGLEQLEFSLKMEKLKKLWILGARGGVYPPARLI